MTDILEVNNVSKAFDGKKVLEDVSVALARGEFLSLLGPSGSGKTTLLSIISGLTKADSGRLILNGGRIDDLPPFRRNIGVVFQNYALFPHLTVQQNIAFPLEMRGMSSSDIGSKVGKVLEIVRLGEHASKYPRQLSGGQQQRVALARAIVFSPPILLMDEPLSALDKNLRMSVQLEIMSLHQEIESSIVYVTHDQDEAVVMSDRIAVFRDGRIEQMGTPADLYERPQNHFVASFVGETNFLPGTVDEVGDGYCRLQGVAGPLRGRLARALARGSGALISIRPERIRVGKGPNGDPPENRLSGRVERSIYLGRGRKLMVATNAGNQMVVLVQSGEPFQSGDAVDLSWSADDAVVVPPAA